MPIDRAARTDLDLPGLRMDRLKLPINGKDCTKIFDKIEFTFKQV